MARNAARIAVLILCVAAFTHLLRTALGAPESLAIPAAIIVALATIVLGIGKVRSDTRASRLRLPWLTLPIVGLALWAASNRLFGAFDVRASIYHLQNGIAYDGVGADIAEFAGFLVFASIFLLGFAWLRRRDRRLRWIDWIGAGALLLVNPVTAFALDSLRGRLSPVDLTAMLAPLPEQSPTEPKNLLIIYLESIEDTFSDPSFGNVFADYEAVAAQGLRIRGIGEVESTGWTIAGIVASQCGVPLLSYGLIMRNRMKNIDSFLPGADCLASRLSDDGYQTEFIGAGPLEFAGKGRFLATHGYQQMWETADFDLPADTPIGTWGAYDDTLFNQALTRLEALDATGDPWLLSVLTLGAHMPSGYADPDCAEQLEATQADPTLQSVICTGRHLIAFLDEARSRGLLDDMIVLVTSDHLGHRSTVYDRLDRLERMNFTVLIGPDITPGEVHVTASMLDVFPTLLDALGYGQSGGVRAGLGTSLLAHARGSRPQTLQQTMHRPTLSDAIRRDTALRNRLWSVSDSDNRSEP